VVSAWETFLIEAGLVVKVVTYAAVFVAGAWVGWQLKSAVSILPLEENLYDGTSPVVTGGVKLYPKKAGVIS